MSKTKPQKRFVSRGRYVATQGMRVTAYSLAVFALATGLLGLLLTLGLVFVGLHPYSSHWLWCALTTGIWTFAMLCCSRAVFTRGKQIEPVQPLTDRNAHLLPLQETLVRASDLPPTEQPSELLRAVGAHQETPKEEMLRSVTADE